MDEFRRVLETYEIDGFWHDYHHSHSSWERDDPVMPDIDFSVAALEVAAAAFADQNAFLVHRAARHKSCSLLLRSALSRSRSAASAFCRSSAAHGASYFVQTSDNSGGIISALHNDAASSVVLNPRPYL
jgi:hypothetical protein